MSDSTPTLSVSFASVRNGSLTGVVLALIVCLGGTGSAQAQAPLEVTDQQYLDSPALDVLVHHTHYDQYFGDQKIQGIEFIHHGARTVTNGDVRLSPTPEQWDPVPVFGERTVDSTAQRVSATLT